MRYAHAQREHVAVLDDAAARRCARSLNLRVMGTGGLLVMAKREGIILSVADALDRLKTAGLWFAPQIERILLKSGQESE